MARAFQRILILLPVAGCADNGWFELNPSGDKPTARDTHSAVFDGSTRQMLVFGGYGSAGSRNDLWRYDVAGNSWVELNPSGDKPAPRNVHSAVFDGSGLQMFVFGGYGSAGSRSDLWRYDFASNVWTELSPSGDQPAPRYWHSAVLDGSSRQMLVFGGYGADSSRNDLWRYDVDGNTWAELSPSGDKPVSRHAHSAVFDGSSLHMLVFGGYGAADNRNDLWRYDVAGNAWTELVPSGDKPFPRLSHSAVFDASSRQMLIFGSYEQYYYRIDLWRYDVAGNAWAKLSPPGKQPSIRKAHSAVFDGDTHQILVFGGYDGQQANRMDDLWFYEADPTAQPTASPTADPTADPTVQPTASPTADPTADLTAQPTASPTADLTADLTAQPTASPTADLTADPTAKPTASPTADLTADPTVPPTASPTADPTADPTVQPTAAPTADLTGLEALWREVDSLQAEVDWLRSELEDDQASSTTSTVNAAATGAIVGFSLVGILLVAGAGYRYAKARKRARAMPLAERGVAALEDLETVAEDPEKIAELFLEVAEVVHDINAGDAHAVPGEEQSIQQLAGEAAEAAQDATAGGPTEKVAAEAYVLDESEVEETRPTEATVGSQFFKEILELRKALEDHKDEHKKELVAMMNQLARREVQDARPPEAEKAALAPLALGSSAGTSPIETSRVPEACLSDVRVEL